MENWIRAMFGVWNQILCTGVVFGVLLLLRPLLVRLVTPQQRVWLWYAAWASVVILSTWGIVGRVRVLPVNLWDLLIPRFGGPWESPSLLPSDYDGPGIYTLALPGGGLAPIPLTNEPCFVLTLLYLAGAAALAVWMVRRSLAMKQLGRLGVPLDAQGLSAMGFTPSDLHWGQTMQVWITPGLPTSFILWNSIYLQAELPLERRRLVLLHELEHLDLRHNAIKSYMAFSLALGWWNPLFWIAWRYACLDMELACDARTMKRLAPEERREYAKILLDAGAGKSMWDMPLAFGESDGERRVKALLAWKPLTIPRKLLGLCAAALVMCLFLGTP